MSWIILGTALGATAAWLDFDRSERRGRFSPLFGVIALLLYVAVAAVVAIHRSEP